MRDPKSRDRTVRFEESSPRTRVSCPLYPALRASFPIPPDRRAYPCREVKSMSVRPALPSAFGSVRVSGTALAVMAALLALVSTSANAADIRSRVRFDPNDVRLVETSTGPRVLMRGLTEAGGEDTPSVPMAVRTFYVPYGSRSPMFGRFRVRRFASRRAFASPVARPRSSRNPRT